MSFTAMKHAMQLISEVKMTPSAKLVLLGLSNRHNQETGRCDPSLGTLAKDLGISDRAVRRGLRELEKLRLVATVFRKRRYGESDKNMTSRYRLRGGDRMSAPLGTECPPKQESTRARTPSAFDDLVFLIDPEE